MLCLQIFPLWDLVGLGIFPLLYCSPNTAVTAVSALQMKNTYALFKVEKQTTQPTKIKENLRALSCLRTLILKMLLLELRGRCKNQVSIGSLGSWCKGEPLVSESKPCPLCLLPQQNVPFQFSRGMKHSGGFFQFLEVIWNIFMKHLGNSAVHSIGALNICNEKIH